MFGNLALSGTGLLLVCVVLATDFKWLLRLILSSNCLGLLLGGWIGANYFPNVNSEAARNALRVNYYSSGTAGRK